MISLVILLVIVAIGFITLGSFAGGHSSAKNKDDKSSVLISVFGVVALCYANSILYYWNTSTVGEPGRLSSGVIYRLISQTPTENGNLVILQGPSGDYHCVLSPDVAFSASVRFAKVSFKTDTFYTWELVAVMPFEPAQQSGTDQTGKKP